MKLNRACVWEEAADDIESKLWIGKDWFDIKTFRNSKNERVVGESQIKTSTQGTVRNLSNQNDKLLVGDGTPHDNLEVKTRVFATNVLS